MGEPDAEDVRLQAVEPQPARRVTLRYEGGVWSADVSPPTLPTILRGTESVEERRDAGRAGAWYEVVDRSQRVVYRRSLFDPHGQLVEGRKDGERIGFLVPAGDVVHSVLVPDLADGGRLDLWASPPLDPERPGRATHATRVLSVPLPARTEGGRR